LSAATRPGGHGWWPYLLPYVGFLLTVEVANRMPTSAAGVMLFVKPAVPLILLAWFFARGAYPELRSSRLDLRRTPLDVLFGVALALLWMAPYVLIAAIRPEVEHPFDPALLGVERESLVLGVRLFGYALVTPVFEELFIRSFVMRYADVYAERGDFRLVPLAHYSGVSFVTTVIVFTIGHVPWEWWVAVPWVAATNLWFYWRRDILALIVVHGVTNATILLIAIFGGGRWMDASGAPLSLWFFV
jgi:CAAX prenyl protease-like protein